MKDLKVSLLLDFYGDLLTSKQYEAIEKYYNQDLSLAEIAMNQGISRQGVRDAIKRAESVMFDIENKLGLVEKFYNIQDGLTKISGYIDNIENLNNKVNISIGINDNVSSIRETISEISKWT